jgi:hypothetical protein
MDQAQLALHRLGLRQSAFSCKYSWRSLTMPAITMPRQDQGLDTVVIGHIARSTED